MRILVLHSHVPANAPPEEQDTLVQAQAVSAALIARGHHVSSAAFFPENEKLVATLTASEPELVFNLVEGVDGVGRLAYLAPQMLDDLNVKFTGCDAQAMSATTDKTLTKRIFREAGLPTPDWSSPPHWAEVEAGLRYIVKSSIEDASIGLDDNCVVSGTGVRSRAEAMQEKYGGRWFAERYIDGREFNIAVIEEKRQPRVLPLAEMVFAQWPAGKPRIVGYDAKWQDESLDSMQTVRVFGLEEKEPALAEKLTVLARQAWDLFALSGYARVDFRVDDQGEPLILEINTNPCISPDAGLPAAAAHAGMDYEELIARIIDTAMAG